jgi:Putative transposase
MTLDTRVRAPRGGGISHDSQRWVSSRPSFLLPVHVLSKLFRRLFLTRLIEMHAAGRLHVFGDHCGLSDRRAFLRQLAPVRRKKWVVFAKPPFAGPEAVLAYLSHYTHRVAISNRRLIALDESGVTFRTKDYSGSLHWLRAPSRSRPTSLLWTSRRPASTSAIACSSWTGFASWRLMDLPSFCPRMSRNRRLLWPTMSRCSDDNSISKRDHPKRSSHHSSSPHFMEWTSWSNKR